MKRLSFATSVVFLTLYTATAWAGPGCTMIADAKSGEVLVQEGACGTRASPASSFKIALSVMGYDAGILIDAHTPAWPYKDEYKAMMDNWRITTDPTIWQEDSTVWYSQVLTKTLGMERFSGYVNALSYGNRDLAGDPGRDNGLSNAWLSSSLQISPAEQVAFVRRMLAGQLPVSPRAVDMTMAIVPTFPADQDWTVHGKTGTGVQRGADGKGDLNRQIGWFVGWATKGDRTVVFAKLAMDDEKAEDRAGPRVRAQFIDALPALMAGR